MGTCHPASGPSQPPRRFLLGWERPLSPFGSAAISGLATGIRIISGFFCLKIISLYLGPEGVGAAGNFSNFFTIVQTIANGGILSGVITLTAGQAKSPESLQRILRTAFAVTWKASVILGVVMFLVRAPLARICLGDAGLSGAFVLLAGSLIFIAGQNFFLAILNGARNLRTLMAFNIAGSILTALFTVAFVPRFGLSGILLAFILPPLSLFFLTLRVPAWFSWKALAGPPDRESLLRLGRYSLMSVVSALVVPTSLFLIRSIIVSRFSWEAAGCWEGLNRLSAGYLLLITTSLNVYYLPRLAEIEDPRLLRREILAGYRMFLPWVGILCLSMFFFRYPVVRIVFSDRFSAMPGLFAFQMIGDFFKICAWFIGILFFAKAHTSFFIITEIAFSISLVFLCVTFSALFSLPGITMGYAVNYLLYFLTLLVFFRQLLFPGRMKR